MIEITSRQQQTQRALLDWLRVECGIEKPSNKLVAVAALDSDTWLGEAKRTKKLPPTAAGVHVPRDEYTHNIGPTVLKRFVLLPATQRVAPAHRDCHLPRPHRGSLV
jgi:hypothetical protein